MGSNNIDYRRPFPWILNGFLEGLMDLGRRVKARPFPSLRTHVADSVSSRTSWTITLPDGSWGGWR